MDADFIVISWLFFPTIDWGKLSHFLDAFDQCFCSLEGDMNKEEYKQHIINTVKQIDDIKYLNRILNYVMKYLTRSGK